MPLTNADCPGDDSHARSRSSRTLENTRRKEVLMIHRSTIVVLVGLLFASCAQVPREAVELSATVGRDLSSVYEAHRDLAKMLFTRMRRDVNRFVDDVYAPYQVRFVMSRQQELASSSNPDDRRKSILPVMEASSKPDASAETRAVALKAMEILVRRISVDVESMRKELLDTLNLQQAEVLGSIDRAYQQLHYANSIVTGHLSSVVKVHDAQADLLMAVGVDRDLRRVVGESLADASDKIAEVVEKAETVKDKFDEVEEGAANLKKVISGLKQKLSSKAKKK